MRRLKLTLGILSLFIVSLALNRFYYNKATEREAKVIMVSVKGAVQYSGEYAVKAGSRWKDVLRLCGGIKEDGYLPEGFDIRAFVHEDTTLYVPYRRWRIRDRYEANAESQITN